MCHLPHKKISANRLKKIFANRSKRFVRIIQKDFCEFTAQKDLCEFTAGNGACRYGRL